MQKSGIDNIRVISKSDMFSLRESEIAHTPYETEVMFYGLIKKGDCAEVEKAIDILLSKSVIAGKLSDDPLRQMKYWAICCITLGARYAISGGLDEMTAYSFSDEAIFKIDHMKSEDEIFLFLKERCLALTALVAKSKDNATYPDAVKKCIHFINANLHEKLSLELLSKVCLLSPDYLSFVFKRSTGLTITAYIKEKRLETAKDMLQKKYATSEIAYYLGFCSESYFIKCFKERYGVTPKKFKFDHSTS